MQAAGILCLPGVKKKTAVPVLGFITLGEAQPPRFTYHVLWFLVGYTQVLGPLNSALEFPALPLFVPLASNPSPVSSLNLPPRNPSWTTTVNGLALDAVVKLMNSGLVLHTFFSSLFQIFRSLMGTLPSPSWLRT